MVETVNKVTDNQNGHNERVANEMLNGQTRRVVRSLKRL